MAIQRALVDQSAMAEYGRSGTSTRPGSTFEYVHGGTGCDRPVSAIDTWSTSVGCAGINRRWLGLIIDAMYGSRQAQ